MMNIKKEDFMAGCIVGGSIIGIVLAFMLTLADVASKPAVHSASYAVLHSSPPCSSLVTTDQERATFVSLSGPAPGLLIQEDFQ